MDKLTIAVESWGTSELNPWAHTGVSFLGDYYNLPLMMQAPNGDLASLSAPPERTTHAIALVQSAQILGQMVGPALGGLLADHGGIRAAFFGSSALAAVAGCNMLVMYHEPQVYTQQRRMRRSARGKLGVRDILRTPSVVPILFELFVETFTNRSYQPLIPLFVASTMPVQSAVVSLSGVIVTGEALAATVSANMASRLVLSFTHAQVLLLALIACACGSCLLVCSHTALQFGLLRGLVGLFDGSILTLSYGLGGSVFPVEHRAMALGC